MIVQAADAVAAEVVDAFTGDHKVETFLAAHPDAWPALSQPNAQLQRLITLHACGRQISGAILNMVWVVYELDWSELGRVKHIWTQPPWTEPLASLFAKYRARELPANDYVEALRLEARAGRLAIGTLLGFPTANDPSPVPESLGLADGHHRVVAFDMEGPPPTVWERSFRHLPSAALTDLAMMHSRWTCFSRCGSPFVRLSSSQVRVPSPRVPCRLRPGRLADVLECHGRLRVVAVITEREPVRRILANLGMATDAPLCDCSTNAA